MTKEEAKQQLSMGKILTHRFFDDDEFIELHHPGVYTLSGKYNVHDSVFWHDRTSPEWETDWEFYHKQAN